MRFLRSSHSMSCRLLLERTVCIAFLLQGVEVQDLNGKDQGMIQFSSSSLFCWSFCLLQAA